MQKKVCRVWYSIPNASDDNVLFVCDVIWNGVE
jgi:hypothetical protein